MTAYKITSDKTTLGKQGATVNADALAGLNVDALIEGGHVEVVVNVAPKKFDKKEQD